MKTKRSGGLNKIVTQNTTYSNRFFFNPVNMFEVSMNEYKHGLHDCIGGWLRVYREYNWYTGFADLFVDRFVLVDMGKLCWEAIYWNYHNCNESTLSIQRTDNHIIEYSLGSFINETWSPFLRHRGIGASIIINKPGFIEKLHWRLVS